MVSQHGIKYAVHLITNHFGNLVAKVCECLLRKGPLTLQNVVRFTELTETQVRNSLLVLIQHNCVQAFILEDQGGFGDVTKFHTQYIVLFDNIIHRGRFSKFLEIASREFDKQCQELIQGLLQHGRLTVNQMHDRSKSSQVEGHSMSLDTVREYLHKLVAARYVERCPSAEPVLAPPNEEETPAKKRGAKSAKVIEEKVTMEQRVLAAAVPMEAKRFSLMIDTEPGADEDSKNESPCKHVGDKRKRDTSECNRDSGAAEETVLWRANFEEFVRRLRYKACIETIRARSDDQAAIVLNAMLEASRSEEKKVKTGRSVPLSLNTIYEEVIKNENGRNMTFDHIRSTLLQLSSPPFVRVVDDLYSIDFKHIIEAAQSDEVESVVLKRYGRDAYKMFRLLSKAGHLLETDKISNATFVESKDTPKVLYRLWQDDYLLMEKIVVGATTFLLWKVNKPTLWEHVLDEMFHAALNVSIRLAYELEQGKQILNLPVEKRVGEIGTKFEKLKKVRMLLESSQMKLDDAIMLFHDF